MIRAAGLLITHDGKALFLCRSPGSDHPGEWCFPGGRVEGDETLEACAERETIEEIGLLPGGKRSVLARSISPTTPMPSAPELAAPTTDVGEPVDFTTYLQPTPEAFIPTLSDEHTAYAWADVTAPPEPLHPGCRIALAKLTMNELDIARAMAAGELTSPQQYMNLWLFAIRITGTSYAYRSAHKEHVWRDASLYLNDDFLARCNGLAVIWVHPEEEPLLDSAEYSKRTIGAIFLPYTQGDEVWGIAKIYNAEAAAEMQAEQLSTSPGVSLTLGESRKLIAPDGQPLLVEGSLDLMDHIAIVPYGVWDKGGDPAGVLNHSLNERADSMADETAAEKEAREKKERDDAARKDLSPGIEADKLLAKLDAMQKRMDEMEMDRGRRDAEDAQRRRDAEREPWMKEDAAACERDDAEEATEREALEAKGEAKEVAADKARKDRKDRMDARRKDAEGEKERREKEDKARRDTEEKARADAEVRATAERTAAIAADTAKMAAAIASMPKSHADADHPAMADAQTRADAAYQALGLRAPGALQGETVPAYRTRLARGVQKHSVDWAGVELHKLEPAALDIAERRIYADAAIAANSSDHLPEDVLVPRTFTNQETGHRITEFRGRHTFIHGLKRPSMRATEFLTGKRGA